MSLVFETFNPENDAHESAAITVAEWSAAAPSMKTITPDALKAYELSLLAFGSEESRLLGHVAVSKDDRDFGVIECLVVHPDLRGFGMGALLVKELTQTMSVELPEIHTCTAFANEASVKSFEAAGGVVIGSRRRPVETGCNTIIDVMPAMQQSKAA